MSTEGYRTRAKRLLFEQDRTQRSLARETGINEGRLSQYLNGRRTPGERNRQLIADALGGDPQTLFLPDALDAC